MDDRPRNQGPAQDPRFGEAVGRTIKVLRTDHGLSRKELAERVDISYSYLSEIENGNKPPSNVVLGAIAATLGMQLHELIADAERRLAPPEFEANLFSPAAPASPAPWVMEANVDLAPPSVRRHRSMRQWQGRDDESHAAELQPTYSHGRQDRSARSLSRDQDVGARELRELVRRLSPEDLERVLDLARRLAR
ncbi:MAG: helix-turn-helix domain-containing protein [Actinobacteria bacterium]|nr:helix-turn-helix domain-containing protein [Actinomycetota bacterium]